MECRPFLYCCPCFRSEIAALDKLDIVCYNLHHKVSSIFYLLIKSKFYKEGRYMKNLKLAAALVCAVLAVNALTAVSSAAEDKITYPENWRRVTDTPADTVAWITGTDYLLLKRNRTETTKNGTWNVTSSAVYSFADYEKQILDFEDEPYNVNHALGQLYFHGVYQFADKNVISAYNGFNGNNWFWNDENFEEAYTNYYDTSGKKILGPYFAGTAMCDGYAVVAMPLVNGNATLAVIDQTGKTITKLPSYLGNINLGEGNLVSENFAYRIGFMSYSEGLFPFWCSSVQFDGSFDKPVKNPDGGPYQPPEHQYGFMDIHGKIAIAQQFDFVQPFSDGLAVAAIDGKYGYIDKTGKAVIPMEYDYAYSFEGGYAGVCKDGKWGCIDKDGKVVLPLKHDACFGSDGVLFSVGEEQADGEMLYSLIRADGTVLADHLIDVTTPVDGAAYAIAKGGEYSTEKSESSVIGIYDYRIQDSTGDYDQNGEVDVSDAQNTLVEYTASVAKKPYAFNPLTYAHCDVNGDGELDAADAQLILQFYTSLKVAHRLTTWEKLLALFGHSN